MHGCVSRLSLCGPVMDWWPVQGVPRLSLNDRWDRLQPPRDPTDGLSGYRKWMDGLKFSYLGISVTRKHNQTKQILAQWSPLSLYLVKCQNLFQALPLFIPGFFNFLIQLFLHIYGKVNDHVWTRTTCKKPRLLVVLLIQIFASIIGLLTCAVLRFGLFTTSNLTALTG